MKKATTKRERKYGKSEEKIIEEAERSKKDDGPVILMVDYGATMRFKNRIEAEKWIEKQHEKADRSNRPRSSFVFI